AISLPNWIVSFSRCVVRARNPQPLRSLFRCNESAYLWPNTQLVAWDLTAHLGGESHQPSGGLEVSLGAFASGTLLFMVFAERPGAVWRSKQNDAGWRASTSSDSTGHSGRRIAEIGWHP